MLRQAAELQPPTSVASRHSGCSWGFAAPRGVILLKRRQQLGPSTSRRSELRWTRTSGIAPAPSAEPRALPTPSGIDILKTTRHLYG